jgi:hypothetical protein
MPEGRVALKRRRLVAFAASGWCAACSGQRERLIAFESETAATAHAYTASPELACGLERARFTSAMEASSPAIAREVIRDFPMAEDGIRARVFYSVSTELPRASPAPPHVVSAARYTINAVRLLKKHNFRMPAHPEWTCSVYPHFRHVLGSRPSPEFPPRHFAVHHALRGSAQASVILHEIVHWVQHQYLNVQLHDHASYDDSYGPFFSTAVAEGGARALEELVNGGLMRYAHDGREWFTAGGSALFNSRRGMRAVTLPPRYSSGLFWKYVAEQHGGQRSPGAVEAGAREALTQRLLLEALGEGALPSVPPSIQDIRRARRRMHGPGHFDQLCFLDADRRLLACGETTWGNFVLAIVLNGTAGSDTRFRFDDAPQWRGLMAERLRINPLRNLAYEALPQDHELHEPSDAYAIDAINASSLGLTRLSEALRRAELELRGEANTIEGATPPVEPAMIEPFTFVAWRVRIEPSTTTRLLRIRFEPRDGLNDALVQVVTLDGAGHLTDLFRHDGTGARKLDRTIPLRNASEALIVIAARMTRGSFKLALTRPPDAPLLHVTSWNGVVGRHLTRDTGHFERDWSSPDIRYLREGGVDKISVRVRNQGTAMARIKGASCWRYPRAPFSGSLGAGLPQVTEQGFDAVGNRIQTEDECLNRAQTTPQTSNLIEPLMERFGSCHFANAASASDVTEQSYVEDPERVAKYRLDTGWSRGDVVVFQIEAEGDPNGPCVAMVTLGEPPRLPPDWRP